VVRKAPQLKNIKRVLQVTGIPRRRRSDFDEQRTADWSRSAAMGEGRRCCEVVLNDGNHFIYRAYQQKAIDAWNDFFSSSGYHLK